MSVQNKHFLNTAPTLVLDSLEGLARLNPALALDPTEKVVYVQSPDRSKVALICGGGSGHEPAHAGFVGDGILTAAVCGSVFASPNAVQVRRAIDLVDNDKGTLIIVKNYTGDVLNFGLAKEQYAALHADKADKVKFLIVGDDVAVGRNQGKIVGRRGLAGTVLVYKIAGALARRGSGLDEVYNIAEWVSSRVGTIGVGLEHTQVPGNAPAKSHLGADEIEIGMGIHNEPGHRRISPVPPLKELIPQLLEFITSTSDPDRSFLPFRNDGSDEVVLMVNNLGGVSELELVAVVGEAVKALQGTGVTVHRVLSGSFMSSLNMPGFSLTLLLLPQKDESSAPSTSLILSLLDEKAETPGWRWTSGSVPPSSIPQPSGSGSSASVLGAGAHRLSAPDPAAFVAAVERACKRVIEEEPEITRMDTIAGDGDCGLTLKAGAEAVLQQIQKGAIKGDDVLGAVIQVSQVAEKEMGGTSGALYSIFFSALAQGLQSSAGSQSTTSDDIWKGAISSALAKLYTYTRARPPSRTLIDPLAAFVQSFPNGFPAAVKAAAGAADATKDVEAKAGRSAYVEGDRLKKEKVPDPGAWGVKAILEGLLG
ncbi:dihydroxyacetone kinase [Gloeophyllum trabeum ATCC 11539]|uniref:Dihydroxyacetone kinase n=1 Tax=Gloeophyllum trabeum (strain ATCC 11539 / FP-39264 / Madison 617) TaxID=670483 RepID=S7QAE7_GLOTA|nr:dihydroxyacetone kinase [Gloeophyllum trabeum ATCC 11539]EPQ56353.1 dihydroxyacetone kinase [Gloeophyllum trabeum ATCC 11539]